jgi:cytochrome c5
MVRCWDFFYIYLNQTRGVAELSVAQRNKSKNMKYKVLVLSVLAVIIYSCASKSSVPKTEVKKTEPNLTTTEVEKTEPKVTTAEVKIATVMTPELAEGKSLFENNCAKCHKLYNPKDFSAEQWKPIIAVMQKEANLDDVAGQKIYNYLTMN